MRERESAKDRVGGKGKGKSKMGQEYGEEQAALNDLGHSPLPFLFQSLRELDQVVSRALLDRESVRLSREQTG